MTFAKAIKVKDAIENFFDKKYQLIYVAETNNWVIKWVGEHIIKNLNKKGLIKSRTSLSSFGLRNKIIHFGSINSFMSDGLNLARRNNKIVVSWFHVVQNDERLKYAEFINKNVDVLLTSCKTTKNELVKNGIKEEKIIIIPLGADIEYFKMLPEEKKKKIKEKKGIDSDKIIIGSFQKDGNGWGKGLEPKLIKGPDIFCDVVERLAKKYSIEVLLTGPARGYVKKRLEDAGIPYIHKIVKEQKELVDYYNCLDLYLISSRIEGGPEALLESWACGVPVVSTRMGMPADVIRDGENGLLAEVEDVGGLISAAEKIMIDEVLRNKIIKESLEEVKKYDWKILAQEYYDEVYKKLL